MSAACWTIRLKKEKAEVETAPIEAEAEPAK